MSTGAVPPSRRPRLSRDMVLSTALRIVDEEGVVALSMRRLATELDRDPMRLYAHAKSKDDLLDGVVEYMLREFSVSKPLDGDWEQALRETAHRLQDLVLAHPNVAPLIITRGLTTPFANRPLDSLQPVEDLLEIFATAGFDDRGILHACQVYVAFLQGQILASVQKRVYNADETDAVLRFGLHKLPMRRFPRLRALAGALAEMETDGALDRCFDTFLNGLRSDLERCRREGGTRPGD